MVHLHPIVGLTLIFLCCSPAVAAGPIEDRVQHHIEAAADGGLTPADYHHLVFTFSWRKTLEDWSLAERGLDRLSAVRQIDPLMADEIAGIRQRLGKVHPDLGQVPLERAELLQQTVAGKTRMVVRNPR